MIYSAMAEHKLTGIRFLIGFCLAVASSACSKPSPSFEKMKMLEGNDLVTFAIETNHSFELTDVTTGKSGKFVIASGHLEVSWADLVVGDAVVLNEKQICTKTCAGVKRCYALFIPGAEYKSLNCTYLLESVYEEAGACLRDSNEQ
jgi:hypothetical protein